MKTSVFEIVIAILCLAPFSWGREFYLTTNYAESFTQGYRITVNDLSIDGNPLRLGGVTYKRGLGTHANGEIVYRLGGAAKRFSALVGIDDETNKLGTVIFKVVADGKEVFNSDVMKGGDPPKKVELDISNVNELRLICEGTDDRISYDHADWVEARIETNDKDLIARIREAEQINYLNLKDRAEVDKLREGDQPIELKAADGSQVLSFYPQAGVYDIYAGNEKITGARLAVNGEEVLRQGEVQGAADHLIVRSKLKTFEIETCFGQYEKHWLSLQVKIKNSADKPHPLNSLIYLLGNLDGILNGKPVPDLRIFTDSYSMWDEMPGHQEIGENMRSGKYISSIFSPDYPQAWTIGFAPPQDWPGTISTHGNANELRVFIDLFGKPFMIGPGEEVVFDRMILTGQFNLVDGLLAYGACYRPHFDLANVKKIHGYNSWEYYKGDINAETMGQALKDLSAWEPAREAMTYFVLDNGWKNAYGDWTFIKEKWPAGGKAWTDSVNQAGLAPGIWLAPFWMSPELTHELNLRDYPPNESDGLAKLRVLIDPSDPGLRDRICRQLHELREMGFRYFKTDFLFDVYKGNRDYKYSKYAPERVMREFMQAIRQAMGEDAFWLACGTVTAPCAGLVDASRVGMDIKASWGWLRDTIVRRNAVRFWMHGNLWLCDQDFLVVRGPDLWKKGFEEPLAVDVAAPGFSLDEARTWCAYTVITGGPVIWSDHPAGITDAGRDLVARTLRHGGGHAGIPLDLEKTNLPTRWVRRESDRIYLALFNWDEKEATFALTPQEVPELGIVKEAVGIFDDKKYDINTGRLETTLKPHQSLCVFIAKGP